MRLRILIGCLAALFVVTSSADAAIKKYVNRGTNITNSPQASPNPSNTPTTGPVRTQDSPGSVFLIDDSGADPVLKKWLGVTFRSTTTIVLDATSGTAAFFATSFTQGPGGDGIHQGTPAPFTGSGSTAGGSTIAWGVVTSWTVSGNEWCNANPPVICSLASRINEETQKAPLPSSFYDLGTWFFHDTGFTSVPYVRQYFTNNFGNNMNDEAAFLVNDATVPALPLVGLALLGGSLVAGGIAATRRRKD